MSFGNRKIFSRETFSLELSHFKKYHSSGNLKLNTSGIFQSLELRILVEKALSISLKV